MAYQIAPISMTLSDL